jgi:hypothetical protein
MAIRVRHEAPLDVVGGFAQSIGQAQGAQQQAQLDDARTRFLLEFGERRRQFDVNTGLRLNDDAKQQQRYFTDLAARDTQQQRLLYDQEQRRQSEFAQRQMMGQQQLAQQEMEQAFEWYTQGAKSLDEQAFETQKAANQLKLTPEGQRIKNEWAGKLHQVRSQRNSLRPDAYNSALGQALAEYEQLGLDAYVEEEPTAAEEMYSNIVPMQGQQIEPGKPLPPGLYHKLKGMRAGAKQFETITVPPPEPATFAEWVAQNTAPAADGGQWVKKKDGSAEYIPPPKPGTDEKPEPAQPIMAPRDRRETRKAVLDELEQEWQNDPAYVGSDEMGNRVIKKSFVDYKNKHIDQRIKDWNRGFGDPIEDDLTPSELYAQAQGPTMHPEVPNAAQPADDGEAPIVVNSRAEAEAVPPGKFFTFNGVLYQVTGPGQAEPVEMQ